MSDIQSMLESLTPDIIARFKTAIELGRWPDGRELTTAQRETCMQAIIVYEHKNLGETERTGYVPPKNDPCAPKDHVDDQPVKWQ